MTLNPLEICSEKKLLNNQSTMEWVKVVYAQKQKIVDCFLFGIHHF